MKIPQALIVGLCLLGATHLAVGQVKASISPVVSGYLDPATGKFTSNRLATDKTQASAQTAQPAVTGTSTFFRESFAISIANYDQPSTAGVACQVDLGTYDDANGAFSESASIAATATSGGWTCNVPVLTNWVLQNPTQDSITATVTVTVYTQVTPVPLIRTSGQSLTLAVPANAQTVNNTVSFKL